MTLTLDQLEKAWGKPAGDVSSDLERFSASAKTLSNEHANLIETHPQQWIGVHDGAVKASGRTMKSVLNQLEESGCAKEEAIVRFISRDQVTLIL